MKSLEGRVEALEKESGGSRRFSDILAAKLNRALEDWKTGKAMEWELDPDFRPYVPGPKDLGERMVWAKNMSAYSRRKTEGEDVS